MKASEIFLIETINDNLPKNVIDAFDDLANKQRGLPESAMLKIQHLYGGGVLNPVVEHAGDLIHRMTENIKHGYDGYQMVYDKIEKVIRRLTHDYGFEREMEENINVNAKWKRRSEEPVPDDQLQDAIDDLRSKVYKALEVYANEHSKLPVYNRPQWLARQITIDIGHRNWKSALSNLYKLKEIADNADRYSTEVRKYQLDGNGNLIEYNPSGEKINESMNFYPSALRDHEKFGKVWDSVFPNEWGNEYDHKHPNYNKWLYSDEDVEVPKNPHYRSDLDLNLSNSNAHDVMDILGFSGIDDEHYSIPIDQFIGKAQQWLKQNLGKPSEEIPTSVEKSQNGPTMISGGKQEGYFNRIIHKMVIIAKEGKKYGATHVNLV